jgi:type I restriction enzyme S subunit
MRKYPKYKDSGYHWYGEVPKEWEVKDLKHELKFQTGGTPSTKDSRFYEGENTWVTIGDMNGTVVMESSSLITNDGIKAANIPLTPKGSLLYSFKLSVGQVAFAGKDFYTNEAIASFLPSSKYEIGFWFYALPFSLIHYANENIYGAKLLNQELIKNAGLIIPSKEEQLAIVSFLDYKTGQIDSFIANRQKQIDLLKEQLHFKINQAITKGINSKTNFKQTDIKYVPEIPEHWDIRKFKSLTSILTCGVAATPEYVDESEGVAFLSAQNCRPFAMDLSKYNFIKPALHKQLTRYKKPQKGDVLVTRVGAGIGQACIIDTDLEFSVYVSLTHIRPNKEMLSEYIVYFFNTEYCYQLNHEGTVVAGGQGNLNVKNVERYRIPLPPIEEQKEIIAYLDNYRLEMDNLISKYQKQIDLMQEYRTSLISQAVTGKIDVREWQPKKQQTA